MSYTLDEKGVALTETRDGVTMPVDCSFEKVNGWIHGIDVQFEELQALCLGMAAENDRLRAKLKHHVLSPTGTDEIKGNAATAVENHRALCDYLQGKSI